MKIASVSNRAAREQAEKALRGSAWFGPIPAGLQERLLAHGRWKLLAPGANLAMAGEEAGGLFGVGAGTVFSRSAMAPDDIAMTDLHSAPFWFISQTLLPGETQLVSVVAQTPATMLFIPQSRIFETMIDYPELRHHLFRHVAGLFTRMTMAMSDLLIADSDARCIAVLLRVAGRRASGSAPATVPIGQMELAGMANVSRQKIGDVLRDLERQGLVSLGYRRIIVERPEQLRGLTAA